MLLFWWAGSLASTLLTESFVYSRLRTDADSLLAAIEFPALELDRPRLGDARLNPAYEEPFSGKYYVIKLLPEGEITSRSAWEQALPVPQLAAGQLRKIKIVGAAGEPLLMWMGGFSKAGHGFTIGIAEDISPIRARLTIFQWYFAAISLLLLIALLTVQHLIVKRSVQKLEAIRGDMNKLGHGEVLSLSEDVPAEILPLVQEFNRLLMRFDKRLKQSRNSVGNLAHSLKGPLNLLLRGSESAGSELTDEQRNAITQNSERIRQLIESELKRARLAGRSAAGQLFDLEAELPALCGLLKQEYSDKEVDIRYNIASDAEVNHDRQDMLELIGNLLDNAAKWAKSVVMFNVREANGVLLDIEDDGPGCSPDEYDRLTQRGVRLDESVAGHGLGLSIVRDIVDTYGGTLEFSHSTRLGGLRVSVFLPDTSNSPD